MIFRSCLITASQPITTLHPLSARTSISPSALQIRPYSALKSLSAILYLLKYIFISRSISVCWLLASDLKIPMQTPSVDETGPITEEDFSLADGLIMNNFMGPSQTRLPRHTSLTCCYYISACSASSFDHSWRVTSRFSSDAPGKHRLVYVA